jgi:hypothetical protein
VTVAADPESAKRIDSDFAALLPASWGIAGGVRNAGYVALYMATFGKYGDASEKEFADRVCVGIADATAAAINRAIANKDRRVRRILQATTVDRVLRSVVHTATRIVMNDSQEHVLDWHATLEIKNPLMFRLVSDWTKGLHGVTLEDFQGWK